MTQPNSAPGERARDRLRLELAALAYLDALEADDFDAVADLWERACDDSELCDVLSELSEGLAAEGEPSPGWEADAAKVSQWLKQHLASSSPPPPPAGPLTAGDVAARIAGDDRLLARLRPDERDANALLLTNRTALPLELATASLERWAAGLPVHAGKNYWNVFRHAAVMMTMSRGHRTGLLMAARRKPPAGESSGPGGTS
jgi:hypothetical protein